MVKVPPQGAPDSSVWAPKTLPRVLEAAPKAAPKAAYFPAFDQPGSPLSLLEQQPLLLSLGAARVQTAASYLEGYVGRERLAEFVRLHPLSRRSKPDPNPNPNPNPKPNPKPKP